MKEEKAFGWENWKPKYRRLEGEYIVAGKEPQRPQGMSASSVKAQDD